MTASPTEIAVLTLVPLGVLSSIVIVVYFDSKNKEMDNPSKWAAIVLLTGGIGIIIYLLERTTTSSEDSFTGPYTLPGGNSDHSERKTKEPED